MSEKTVAKLAESYLYFFGMLHIVSVFFGAEVVQFGSIGSAAFLILVLGCGTLSVTLVRYPLLYWVWGVFFIIGWCIEFTEWAQWVIPWRHDQYMLLTCMNAIASICLIYLARARIILK